MKSGAKNRWTAGLAVALGWLNSAAADWELNMPVGVTDTSKDVYDLHMLILWICVAIGVAVYGVMAWSMIFHRKSKGVTPAKFSHSTQAEIVWTIIPAFILVAMAIPSAGVLVRMEDTRESDLTIKVTGYQWKWHYQYIDDGVEFFSNLAMDSNIARQRGSGEDPYIVDNYLLEVDEPLVVPVGAKVRLLLTAADVIHAWWVPEFAIKKDAIPGYVNETWFRANEIGTFRGQCAELCGKDHGFMPVVVEVKPAEDYEAWLAERQEAALAQVTN